MRKAKRTRRAYDVSGRQQRALENQERMLDVARRLFAERGYAETTIEEIAKGAGVAVPTVYAAFQSKRGVLDALLRRQVAGEPGGPPLTQTAGAQEVAAATDPREVLRRFVQHLNGVHDRVAPSYDVMKNAARAEPDVAELLDRMQRYRYGNLETLAHRLAELGALRTGLTHEDVSRTLWVLTSLEVRQLLTVGAGWSTERYLGWLEDLLRTSLLAPQRARPRARREQP